ncbi:hypothetical protein G9A89_022396 [Geosiphon pyriformis]|nr:hypothetical protein G9A89_022396 [Geosiphon pyriformis]
MSQDKWGGPPESNTESWNDNDIPWVTSTPKPAPTSASVDNWSSSVQPSLQKLPSQPSSLNEYGQNDELNQSSSKIKNAVRSNTSDSGHSQISTYGKGESEKMEMASDNPIVEEDWDASYENLSNSHKIVRARTDKELHKNDEEEIEFIQQTSLNTKILPMPEIQIKFKDIGTQTEPGEWIPAKKTPIEKEIEVKKSPSHERISPSHEIVSPSHEIVSPSHEIVSSSHEIVSPSIKKDSVSWGMGLSQPKPIQEKWGPSSPTAIKHPPFWVAEAISSLNQQSSEKSIFPKLVEESLQNESITDKKIKEHVESPHKETFFEYTKVKDDSDGSQVANIITSKSTKTGENSWNASVSSDTDPKEPNKDAPLGLLSTTKTEVSQKVADDLNNTRNGSWNAHTESTPSVVSQHDSTQNGKNGYDNLTSWDADNAKKQVESKDAADNDKWGSATQPATDQWTAKSAEANNWEAKSYKTEKGIGQWVAQTTRITTGTDQWGVKTATPDTTIDQWNDKTSIPEKVTPEWAGKPTTIKASIDQTRITSTADKATDQWGDKPATIEASIDQWNDKTPIPGKNTPEWDGKPAKIEASIDQWNDKTPIPEKATDQWGGKPATIEASIDQTRVTSTADKDTDQWGFTATINAKSSHQVDASIITYSQSADQLSAKSDHSGGKDQWGPNTSSVTPTLNQGPHDWIKLKSRFDQSTKDQEVKILPTESLDVGWDNNPIQPSQDPFASGNYDGGDPFASGNYDGGDSFASGNYDGGDSFASGNYDGGDSFASGNYDGGDHNYRGGNDSYNDGYDTYGDKGHSGGVSLNKQRGFGGDCRICGEEGHMARDCPEKRQGGFGGGGGGGGACHRCGEEGHFARDCSIQTPIRGGIGGGICYKCQKPGHFARECSEDRSGEDAVAERTFNSRSKPALTPWSNPQPTDLSANEAWNKLLAADKEKDIDDFKEAFEEYAKASPTDTFQSIEKKLRDSKCNAHIVALERDIPLDKTLIDLQGNPGKRYIANLVMGDPSVLPRTAGVRASDPVENMVWLAGSGFMRDNHEAICFNCKSKGHLGKDCPEPKKEVERSTPLTCQNCGSCEHWTKFCPETRRDYYAESRDRKGGGDRSCFKCGSSDHISRDCSAIDSRHEMGSRGGRGASVRTCHNCGAEGHISRECSEQKPRRPIICSNCGKGHEVRDCPSERSDSFGDTYGAVGNDSYTSVNEYEGGGNNWNHGKLPWDTKNAPGAKNDIGDGSGWNSQKVPWESKKETPRANDNIDDGSGWNSQKVFWENKNETKPVHDSSGDGWVPIKETKSNHNLSSDDWNKNVLWENNHKPRANKERLSPEGDWDSNMPRETRGGDRNFNNNNHNNNTPWETRTENQAGNYRSGGNFYSNKGSQEAIEPVSNQRATFSQEPLWSAKDSQKDRLRSDIDEDRPDIPWRKRREADDGIKPWASQSVNSGPSHNEPPRGRSVQRKELFGRHDDNDKDELMATSSFAQRDTNHNQKITAEQYVHPAISRKNEKKQNKSARPDLDNVDPWWQQ